MFDNAGFSTGPTVPTNPSTLQPFQRAPYPASPTGRTVGTLADAVLQGGVTGSANTNVTIGGNFDARRAAASQLNWAIDRMQAAHKLQPQEANLLRHIAANPAVSEQRLRLITEGIGHMGKPYNWGSTGPSQFDCSGLAGYVYKHALNLSLPRTSFFQNREGTPVAKQDLKPGDLVFFGAKRTTHVAIYLGDGMMLEAGGEGRVRTDKGSVRIRPLRDDYRGARRFVDDTKAVTPQPHVTMGQKIVRSFFDWPFAEKILNFI